MSSLEKNINLDNEIQQCAITKPYEALQSDFAKKLLDHLASKSKFKENYIRELIEKIDDETESLSPKEWKDFLDFINEHREFFDGIIERYKWRFPVWLQCKPDSDSMDMKYDNHILYRKGEYISLHRICNYIKSRIQGGSSTEMDYILWRDLKKASKKEEYFELTQKDISKLLEINYSERINRNGITIHNLDGILFTAMHNDNLKYRQFIQLQIMNDPDDRSKGKSLNNLNNNQLYIELLKKADAKSFESLEDSNKFHFKLMQIIADHLGFKVIINEDFINDNKNEKLINIICESLHFLTRKYFSIIYKIREDSDTSYLVCDDQLPGGADYDTDYIDTPLSFFLQVDPSLGKEQK